MSLAHPTKDRWNHRDWLRICDCYSYCLQHGIRITECRIIILELLLQITREPRSYINCSKSKLSSRNHLCILEWFQVEIHRNVQTSGSKIIKNIVQMLYFHWKSFLKNCKMGLLLKVGENKQTFGNFEYFLLFTKTGWTGHILVEKFRCII